MTRQIIFRGYNLKNQKWLYGYYLVNRGQHFICPEGFANPLASWEDFVVEEESVGQFTEVKDREGTDIYEGDIVSWYELEVSGDLDTDYETYIVECVSEVIYNYGVFGIGEHLLLDVILDGSHLHSSKRPIWEDGDFDYPRNLDKYPGLKRTDLYMVKVIGNIYENKELLEDEE